MVSICHTCYERGIIILYLFVCLFVRSYNSSCPATYEMCSEVVMGSSP